MMITSIPMQIWFSFVYSAPSYFLTEQPQELMRFMMFVLVLAHVTLLADAYGSIIGTCVNPINGTFLAAISCCTIVLFAGFLVQIPHMPWPLQIVSYTSFLRYAFEGVILSVYSFNRGYLPCPEEVDYCHMKNPKAVIRQFSFKPDNFWVDVGFLFAVLVLFRITAYLLLISGWDPN